ncbi:MAG: NUDIX hydrolase, partial [Flammeovirgaceae bacterium]
MKSISHCNSFIFCIGKQGISEMQDKELSFAIRLEKKIIPILLPNNETSVRHRLLDTYIFVDFRKEFKDKKEITKLFRILNSDVEIKKTPLKEEANLNNNPSKHTTKKAVCVGIVKDGKILVVQRAETQKTGGELWQLPGGKVEEIESNDEAAQREVKEEVG